MLTALRSVPQEAPQASPAPAPTSDPKDDVAEVPRRKKGGKTSNSKVERLMTMASAAMEAGNHEEAYGYFNRVLEADPENAEAWLGKGVSAGVQSTMANDRLDELLAGVLRAVSCAPEGEAGEYKVRGAEEIADVVFAFYKASVDHTDQYIALDDTWQEHVLRSTSAVTALRAARDLDPSNQRVLKRGVKITKALLEGVEYKDPYDTDDDGNAKEKTARLSSQQEPIIQELMDAFVTDLKKVDPSYQAPEVEKVVEPSPLATVGCLAVILAVGFMVLMLLAKLSRGG